MTLDGKKPPYIVETPFIFVWLRLLQSGQHQRLQSQSLSSIYYFRCSLHVFRSIILIYFAFIFTAALWHLIVFALKYVYEIISQNAKSWSPFQYLFWSVCVQPTQKGNCNSVMRYQTGASGGAARQKKVIKRSQNNTTTQLQPKIRTYTYQGI